MSDGCKVRGVRGATMVKENTTEAILTETRRLVALLMRINEISEGDIASMVISSTPDLDAVFPALAARQLFSSPVPMLGCHEVPVPGAPKMCIRILLHWNTDKALSEIKPAYVNGTKQLLKAPPEFDRAADEQWIASQLKELE